MNKLIQQLINKRRVTLFMAIIIAISGIFIYYILPRQENPDVSAPFALIITVYPGGSPTDVKDLITSKIENELVEIDGYDKSIGINKEGLSVVAGIFECDVDNDTVLQEVRNVVNDIQVELPKGCFPSEVRTDLIEAAGIIISLSGENYTYEQLASFGEQFEDKLSNIEGISKFSIEGKLDKEIKVKVDIAKLNQLNISIADISQILRAQNVEIPSGGIDYNSGKIKVKTPGIYSSIDDIRNIIIGVSPKTGQVTKLCDVASIHMDLEEDVEKYKQNRNDAVLLTGYFQKNKNIVIIGKDVRKAIDEVKSTLPKDLLVEEVIYQPDDVSKSVNDFMMNLIEGIILVVIVVFLGMGLRNALVVSTAIPLSVLITFIVMYIFGIEIHQMSLTALIVALGVLVDNAIVISDTIQVKINKGEANAVAAFNGTSMSSVPIFTATLTTIAAFSPLLGLPGIAGKFLNTIPKVLIISIIAAYIVSMFITPSMATILFKKSKDKKGKESKIRRFFRHMLTNALNKKIVTVGLVLVVFIFTIMVLLPSLPSQFFPYTDKDLFYVDLHAEIQGDIDETEKLTDRVSEILSDEPEITSCTVSIGTGLPKFYVSMLPSMPLTDFGQMVCKFDLNKGKRFKSNVEFIDYIQEKLDKNIASGRISAKLLANAKPTDAKAVIRVSGDNLDRLREVANELKVEIAKLPGTTNVRHDLKDKSFMLEVDVDKDMASSFGMTQYDIQRQINMALYGTNASVYRRDGKEYNIRLDSNISNVAMLENFGIKSSLTGNKVLLKQFSKVNYGKKVDEIRTFKTKQSVEILVNELPGYSPTKIENMIEHKILPNIDTSGTIISFDGEREDVRENFGVVGILAILCIFLIYVILLIQFNSFIQPAVILCTVPLSLIGSVFGLYLLNNPLSLTAFLGIIALIGLVVKNGILLIEYINDARTKGHSIDEACLDAVDKRFNPIILSAGTTVMGLLPLALSGSSLFSPMAIALMFGLIVSTFLTMVVIPVIYSIFEGFIAKRKLGKKER
jgi:multidrug efflux pump subunit AcrB